MAFLKGNRLAGRTFHFDAAAGHDACEQHDADLLGLALLHIVSHAHAYQRDSLGGMLEA